MRLRKTVAKPDPRKTMLLIEDDALLCRAIKRACEEHGYDVLHAETGREGVILATERQPDVIMLDLSLPDMDGMQVLGCLKSAPPTVSIPVIIFSGRTDHDVRIASFRCGADDYVEKPCDPDMLMRRVDHLLFKASERVPESGVVGSAEAETDRRSSGAA